MVHTFAGLEIGKQSGTSGIDNYLFRSAEALG